MYPSLQLANKSPDLHIFFIHSPLTLLVANTIIYKEKLAPEQVRFITQGEIYKYIEPYYPQQSLNLTQKLPQIESALGNEDTFIRLKAQRLFYSTIAKFLNPTWRNIFPEITETADLTIELSPEGEFNDHSDYLGNNLTFTLYAPHLDSMLFNALASLPNCTEVNYFEEGLLNYIVLYVAISCEKDVEFFTKHPQLHPKLSGYRYITSNGHYPSVSVANPNLPQGAKFFRINNKALKKYLKRVKMGKFDPLTLITYSSNDVYEANKHLFDFIDPQTQQRSVKSYQDLVDFLKANSQTPQQDFSKLVVLCLDLWFTNAPSQCLANEDKIEDINNLDSNYLLNNEKRNLGIFLESFKKDLQSKGLDQQPVLIKFHPRTPKRGIELITEQLKEQNIEFLKYPGEFLELTILAKSSGTLYLYSSHSTLSYIAYSNPPHQGIMLYKALQKENQHFANLNKNFFKTLEKSILKRSYLEILKSLYQKIKPK